MYEDTTGQNSTTHHSPPLLSAHNPNALLSAQQQSAIQPPHTPHQSSQTNGTHTNGTVASAQPQQIVTPSAASDSPVSPPTGNFFRNLLYLARYMRVNFKVLSWELKPLRKI
jgi:hypothetical protein